MGLRGTSWHLHIAYCSYLLLFCLAARPVESQGQCEVSFTDDFDRSLTIQSTLWSSHPGVSVETACTTNTSIAVLSGNVVIFGGTADSNRYITTKAISLQNARVIQLDVAACPWPGTTSMISGVLEYPTGYSYQTLGRFKIAEGDGGAHVVMNIPDAVRVLQAPVKFRIRQTSSARGKGTEVWSLDNFSILGIGPEYISDNFDPVVSCHWLTLTGTVKALKSSTGSALTFSGIPVSSVGHVVTSIPVAIQDSYMVNNPAKILFEENFDGAPPIPGNNWVTIQGGKFAVPDCGAIDSYGDGFAAFFSGSGGRYIQTQPLDLTYAQTLSFKLQIGGVGCDSAEYGEDVVVEYLLAASLSFTAFTVLKQMTTNEYTSAKDVAISLPARLKTSSTVLRWRQIRHSNAGSDEWALDKVYITNTLSAPTTIFNDHFSTSHFVPGLNWRSMSGGSFTTPDCGSIGLTGTSAFFYAYGDRSITTRPLDLTEANMITFRIRMGGGGGCESLDFGEDVAVEYRRQMADTDFKRLVTLAYNGYASATTVTVTLPPDALGSGTMLRWRQLANSGSSHDEWALDDVTVTGLGKVAATNYIIIEDFDSTSSTTGTIWQSIVGGSIQTPDCGSIDLPGFSSEAAFFSSSSPSSSRYIETIGLDLRSSGFLSFRIQIGGGSGCEWADVGEDVVLEYKHSSSSYVELKRMAYNGYPTAQTVSVTIPTSAKRSYAVLRWRQLQFSSPSADEWAIDHIRLSNATVGFSTDVSVFNDNFDTTPSIPGTWWAVISGGTFATPDCGSIDLVGYSSRAAFFGLSGNRYIRTQRLNLRMARTLSFRFLIGGPGSGSCETADPGDDVVVEYQPAGSSMFTQLMVLWHGQYSNASSVAVVLPVAALTTSTALQWRQISHGGSDLDEWAVDHVSVTGTQGQRIIVFSEDFNRLIRFPDSKWQSISGGNLTNPECGSVSGYSGEVAFFSGQSSRYIQTVTLDLTNADSVSFRLLIGGGSCETADNGEDVVLEYSAFGALVFSRLQLFPYNSYRNYFSDVFVTLSASSKTPSTVLRWRQLSHSGMGLDEWAIEDIQIDGTQATDPFPPLFSEDFYPIPMVPNNKWANLTGGNVTVPGCGGIDLTGYSPQAAFFSLVGPRFIQTSDLDLRAATSLSFVVIIGGLTGCENADPGEDVVVEYKFREGSPSFAIATLQHDAYRTATPITIVLPLSSRKKFTSLIWRQLDHSGFNYDEWAIDDIRIMGSATPGRQYVVNFRLLFVSSTTQQLQLLNDDIRLEYSVDFGQTWGLAQTDWLPSNSQTLINSQYQAVLFSTWKRLTVLLSSIANSNHTQIRWRQPSTMIGTYWAIDDVYYGIECPGLCNGHGYCSNTTGQYEGMVCGGNSDGQQCASSFVYRNKTYVGCTRDGREGIDNELWCSTTGNYDVDKRWGYCICGACRCDPGYSGHSCSTITKVLPRFLKEDFENGLSSIGWAWVGGGIVGTACSGDSYGKSMVFSLGRSRLLETVDLNLTLGTTVEFTVLAGSGCLPPPKYDNNVTVFFQYSTNGGITWILLLTIQRNASLSSESYNLTLPMDTKTASTRVRWYQPIAGGSGLQVWAIDNVTIDSVSSSLPCASFPCLNGGSCTNTPDGTHSCRCPLGFAGKACDTARGPCSSTPCQNGGLCVNYRTGFHCNCSPGFTGSNCETNVDECASNPCQNNAICHDHVDDYSCSCPVGVTGRRCHVHINECLSWPCRNGGTCVDLQGSYHCQCTAGYSGTDCDQYTGACGSSPCRNQGVCHDLANGNFLCACTDQSSGTLCETFAKSASSGSISAGVYAASAVALVVCLLIVTFWIYKRRRARRVLVPKEETVSSTQIQNPVYFATDQDVATAPDGCTVEQVQVQNPGRKVHTERIYDLPCHYENVSAIRPFAAPGSVQNSERVYEVAQ